MATAGNVLIVGAGLAGLTLAAALEQRSVQVEVVERNTGWRADGAGLLVHANGMRVLAGLGIDTAVTEAGIVVRRWAFTDQQGDLLCETDLRALWQDAGPCVGITRASLQRVLLAAASAVPVRLGTSITSLTEEDTHVSVTFTDGRKARYALVVGADGIHSAVRRYAFTGCTPAFAGQLVWRSLAPVTSLRPPSVQFSLGDGCFFGLCTVGESHTYGFANISHRRQRDPVEGRLNRLRNRFASFGPDVRDYLSRLETDEQIHCSPIEWVEQPNWHTRRIVLIGDAAHASSPMMGQGGSLAMEDASVLAEVLLAAPTLPSALSHWARRRRPRVCWVQQESKAVAHSFQLPAPIRNRALRERGDAMLRHRFAPLAENP
jgi:2-polyprenyl-6-methoxyphenol hydroxylase-like FAD-dependent oxidoreductase